MVMKVPEGAQVFGVLHLADLYRDRRMAAPTRADFARFGKLVKGEWPLPVGPRLNIRCDADLDDWNDWLDYTLSAPVTFAVIDTEFEMPSKRLTTIGIGISGGTVCQINWDSLSDYAKGYVGHGLRSLAAKYAIVFQNAVADIPVLEQAGLHWCDYHCGVEDTMLAHAVLYSDWPHDLEFLASLYSDHDKLKHLSKDDPELYNQGDVLDTIRAWEELSKNLKMDPGSMKIYQGQSKRLIPILLDIHPRGIRVNKDRIEPAIAEYEARLAWAREVATAYTGVPTFNIGSGDQVKWWLYDVEGMPVQKHKGTGAVSVDEDSIAVLRDLHENPPDLDEERENGGLTESAARARIAAGAHPLLEARVVYMAAQQVLSHYLYPCCVREKGKIVGIRDRIYPEFKIHAQASGRWSTTNPPLAQLPADLRDIICPDPGQTWISFDWSNIERRNLQALTGSKKLKEIFDNGWDMHTIVMCDIFGYEYPPDRKNPDSPDNAEWAAKIRWTGKEDIRRTFAKRFSYRLDYGGEPGSAGNIPGAKQLGLTKQKLIEASNRYLNSDPDYRKWRAKQAKEAVETRKVYTPFGRRRILMGDDQACIREAYNHPNQGGVADIFNLTVINITDITKGSSRLVYGMHDSQVWTCATPLADKAEYIIRLLAEMEWIINDHKVRFPASFKPRVVGPEEFEYDKRRRAGEQTEASV